VSDVFISYSREDMDFVRRLAEALEKRDRETWVDLEDIRPTEEWLARVYSGIEGANAFVFVISSKSLSPRAPFGSSPTPSSTTRNQSRSCAVT
jgi:hypothetical protein